MGWWRFSVGRLGLNNPGDKRMVYLTSKDAL
jgi:hypothetical protein